MRRPSLRQIEAFRAIVETGTVRAAAEMLYISQPAASKLLSTLEEDIGLNLFDRNSGRLVLTKRGMRLYEEVDRVFSGVDQISRAVDLIRREERDRLQIGLMPGLSGRFVANVVSRFLEKHPGVHVSVEARDSQFLADRLISRQLDVGILTTIPDPTHVAVESLCDEPFWCILPLGHQKARLELLRAEDLVDENLVAFAPDSFTQRRINSALAKQGVRLASVIEANTAASMCEFVAAGLGVAVVHPLTVEQAQGRVLFRPFTPEISNALMICRPQMVRHSELTTSFISLAKQVAQATMSHLREDI